MLSASLVSVFKGPDPFVHQLQLERENANASKVIAEKIFFMMCEYKCSGFAFRFVVESTFPSFESAAATEAFFLQRIPFGTRSEFGRQFKFGNCCFDELFNLRETTLIFRSDERNCTTCCLSTGSTTDTVNVIFGIAGNIVINNETDIFNVDTARENVGSDQYGNISVSEFQ